MGGANRADEVFDAIDARKRAEAAAKQERLRQSQMAAHALAADRARLVALAEAEVRKHLAVWEPVMREYLEALGRRWFPRTPCVRVTYENRWWGLKRVETPDYVDDGGYDIQVSCFVHKDPADFLVRVTLSSKHVDHRFSKVHTYPDGREYPYSRLGLQFELRTGQDGALLLDGAPLTEASLRSLFAHAYEAGPFPL